MKTNQMKTNTFFPPEWVEQDAVLIAWPHADTDWHDMLDEVVACYQQIAEAILATEPLIVVAPDIEKAKADLRNVEAHAPHKVHYFGMPTNDTWARDFGAITVMRDGKCIPLDFKFDAWGMKFAADKDNLITSRLDLYELFVHSPENHRAFVLEGGSVESDGNGTVMTTASCLLSPNRNAEMTKDDITIHLKQVLGAENVLWINNGEMPGDDTDGHIDTLARFAPGDVILYNGAVCPDGEVPEAHAQQLCAMEAEIQEFVNADGRKYNLMQLPVPAPIYDEDGMQLPATYANFLVTNHRVLVPIYGQPLADDLALRIIAVAFPDHEVVGIDCNALIKQHGSLHCVTMQFPKNTLKI
ncbi:MAG: agmatine deiminase family protein [Bacteroidales bacterium]|nr:agmatine deiminase family protein [Bacteroidales bacterium]